MNETPCELIANIAQLHTTPLGAERIQRNLSLTTEDVVAWCAEIILHPQTTITRRGKNWYALAGNTEITINAHSYTIITAHKRRQIQPNETER